MRRLATLLLLSGCITASTQQKFDAALLRQIDARIEQGIADQKYPGGVYHLEQGEKIYEKAYGKRSLVPTVEPMTVDTIFDAASITKVVATTPAIWQLIMKEELMNKPGYVFRYSDINFELLGEIVRRVSGEPLNVFCKKEIFEPLGMTDTDFRPIAWSGGLQPADGGLKAAAPQNVAQNIARIAPTEMTDGVMLRGVVHDPTSRRMGGVAGHAGLFITVHDLAKYCRMLLRGGSPIFRPEIVQQMTSVQSPPNVAVKRAGGFDIDSSYSKPRGEMFPIGSYGHTGFTGGFFWIDPFSKTFFIFLSNRVPPYGN